MDDLRQESDKNRDQRLESIRQRSHIDATFGYRRVTDSVPRIAWLVNVQSSELLDDDVSSVIHAMVDFYFLEESGQRFKVSFPFRPYLYIATAEGTDYLVAAHLSQRYPHTHVEHVEKEDLDLKNHLSGLKSCFLKLSFSSMHELVLFKRDVMPHIKKNRERLRTASDYTTLLTEHLGIPSCSSSFGTARDSEAWAEQIVDIREHDLPYHMRVCIDERIFVGLWYRVVARDPVTNLPSISRDDSLVEPIDPVVCAFDIETTKLPLKFPDSEVDQIMMISYMIDGDGYLIVNREIVAEDVEDFEYTPRPEFPGSFRISNERDEAATIKCFFSHLLRVKPSVIVTYNGDSFDWPFVEARAKHHGMSMRTELGFYRQEAGGEGEYKHNNCVHMDALRWVQRDSYLPMGSQNLKAATKAKLCYDPVELEPELMVDMARQQPRKLASYSVSDAVATYYLYMKYVHPFIFALCTIIPLGPDDVLRKGSGTLCEALLMVEAFHKNIIYPNKQAGKDHKMTEDGHLLESETYVGGHVEALECGVFRADIPCKFRLNANTLQQLKEGCVNTMQNSLRAEMNVEPDGIENFEEVCAEIRQQLESLIEHPIRVERPKIYHLDVGAMYPNIILTNRLQPPAVVSEEDCMACIYNAPDAKCKRPMRWDWRAEIIPATRGEYERLIQQLEHEKFGKPPRPFHLLPKEERHKIEKRRVHDYCRKAYGKLHVTREESRTTTICQRENAFFVDTVLAFRDRRYDYKALLKKAKAAAAALPVDDLTGRKQAQARIVLYESMQLAMKCILNSFYGYAMRKGSRWFSMEMAGIVCKTGSEIITEARLLIEQVGRPLELDTDGIWCLLPASFPENFTFREREGGGRSVTISYPGAILNELLREKFTNHQYHTLLPDGNYEMSERNSILFEVDGPYLAMILPAAKEEGKRLKKRYAVFSFDGKLAELKGFEVKRRGELAIIKHFQSSVFKSFLKGHTLSEIYEHVAKEADYWLDVLHSQGVDLSNEELFELIGENRSMSKKLEEYGEQKSTSITTAKRLSEFLGDDMVKNSGLACRFIISKYPQGAPVNERVLPIAIFSCDPKICCAFLRKWTKQGNIRPGDVDIRDLIDWSYYLERMGSCIQKIVTIPAALQGFANPVPRVPHPAWLETKKKERSEMHLQPRITDIFKTSSKRVEAWNQGAKSMAPCVGAVTRNEAGEEVVVLNGEAASVLNEIQLNVQERSHSLVDGKQNAGKVHQGENLENGAAVLVKKTWARDGFGEWVPTATTNSVGLSQVEVENAEGSEETDAYRRVSIRVAFFKTLKHNPTPLTTSLRFERQADNNSLPINLSTHHGTARMSGRKRKLATQSASENTRQRVKEELWHIIQIAETRVPGQFTVFAVSPQAAMRQFNLTIPRTFYVDEVDERETTTGRVVQKILPNLRAASHLYEYSVDEAEFSLRVNEFNMEMCSTRINGIYETQVPLLFKAYVRMGSSCWLKSARSTTEFNLDQTQMATREEVSYVELDALRLFYFYEMSYGGLTVVVFFSPSTSEGYIFVVNKVRVELPNHDSLYKSELSKFIEKRGEGMLGEACRNVTVHTIQTTSVKEASQRFRSIVKGMKLPPSDPSLFCIQSRQATADLCKEYPALVGFPHVRIRVEESLAWLNDIRWASVMGRKCIQHFFNSYVYLRDRWMMANYIGIPVGNLPEDMCTLALDVLFARQLESKNHLLWASLSSKPDLGGKELEDLRMENEWESISFRPSSGHVYNREAFEAKNVVAELHLGAVAVTALLQNARIAQAEGASETVGFSSSDSKMTIKDAMMKRLMSSGYDGFGVSSAVRILKDVFHDLINDIHLHSNAIADQLVVDMHRWMRNSHSLMYHPGVASAVSNLMHKLVLLLVAEINRLGGSVIHCSLSRVILDTGRSGVPSARTFVDSLIQSLTQKRLFASLQMGISCLATTFMWMDPNNYAFIEATEEGSGEAGQVQQRFSMAEIFTAESGFPKVFSNLVAGYLVELSKGPVSETAFATFCNELFVDEITPSLFELTSKMMASRDQVQLPKEQRPLHLLMQEEYNVALEFVKCVTKLLSLNPHIEEELINVKSQLLQVLQLKDMSSSAEWTPSPISMVFEHVYCKRCLQSADLDVCFGHEGVTQHTGGSLPFLCSQCKEVLPSRVVEEMLIERLSRIVLSFTLQDWTCSAIKCRKVGARSLGKGCECSNQFVGVVPSSEFRLILQVVKRVAERHSLKDLLGAVDGLSRISSAPLMDSPVSSNSMLPHFASE